MRDPFRPNSNKQLILEAQFAFAVIVVLVGVLVYVAFHRVAGRRLRFQRIAQAAPIAQHVDDNAYPAQALLAHEERRSQKSLNTLDAFAPGPSAPTPSDSAPQTVQLPNEVPAQTFSPRPKPSSPTLPAQPLAPKISAAANAISDPGTDAGVAQAQFIESKKSKPAFNPAPLTPKTISKPPVDDPFEKINGPSSTAAQLQPKKKKDHQRSSDANRFSPVVPAASFSEQPTTDFDPPPIRSNFGAGSIRDLPSFDTPAKNPTNGKPVEATTTFDARPAVPAPLPSSPASTDSAFAPIKKLPAQLAKPAFSPSATAPPPVETKVIPAPPAPKKPQPLKKQQPLGPHEYRVQTSDSLWSIALDHYDDGRFFRALHEHNIDRITSADRLEPGTTLVVPEVDELTRRYAKLCPADKLSADVGSVDDDRTSTLSKAIYDRYEKSMDQRFHVTQPGDTLFDVARQRLGQASRYLEIFELNRFRIPQHANHLTPLDPGLRLLLPE